VTARFEIDPSARPVLSVAHAQDDRIRVDASGPANSLGILESSIDLVHWSLDRELTLDAAGRATLTLEPIPTERGIFYRVRLSTANREPE
jgi:hypothetical protein